MRVASTTLLAVLATAAVALAQSPAPSPSPRPSPAPKKEEAPATPRRPAQLANVRLDIKITERRGGAEPVTKLVSMSVADQEQGLSRSVARVPQGMGFNDVPLHVDARPVIDGTKVRLRLSIDYAVQDASGGEQTPHVSTFNVREAVTVVLENGRPMMIADAADPMSDRRVQVEVTATILR
jgi:hypothetical protein